MSDERDEKESLEKALKPWLSEAYMARMDLLRGRREKLEEQTRALKDEIEQLEYKQRRIDENIGRQSVAELRALHWMFVGRETP